ncbi:MAG: hypothetical protein KGQ60_12095 [Planctomycetes bacterium]|nr:hypothetical protein [Planctomycetota bacterium]
MFRRKRQSLQTLVWNLGWLVLSCIGCSRDFPLQEVTYPASGSITYQGRPIPNVEISLFPEDPEFADRVRPKARTDEAGRFILWTYTPGDGVPSGSYKVTAIRQELTLSKGTIVARPNELPPKYSSRDTTPLKVQIAKGKNEIPTIEIR